MTDESVCGRGAVADDNADTNFNLGFAQFQAIDEIQDMNIDE